MKAIFPMSEMMGRQTLEITVTGVGVARFRIWLGCQILKLAAKVIGCGIEIKGQ